MRGYLVLEDGSFYEGELFGSIRDTYGEVVFSTSMTGYQEMLTDPSYRGQILVPTYPLIGNYGINNNDTESSRVQVSGFVVREACRAPSHRSSIKKLYDFLEENDVPGIMGIDTRSVVRKLRYQGVMMGMITGKSPKEALEELKNLPRYDEMDFVKEVSTKKPYVWEDKPVAKDPAEKRKEALSKNAPFVCVIDFGLKFNILRSLKKLGAEICVLPCDTPPSYILGLAPDGILLSPGPGDPSLLTYIVENIKALIGKKPIMGICLGHQLLAQLICIL